MALIDTTFLKVHPRTALWWQQREQCERCAYVKPTASGAMTCTRTSRAEATATVDPMGRAELSAERREAVQRMRADGMPYREIGEKLGISHGHAFKLSRQPADVTSPQFAFAAMWDKRGAPLPCIDAREPGNPCGPEGLLFQEKTR